MRVIGGKLRGKKLFSVMGQQVRPTTDRIRESIFDILAGKVLQTVVLDLFSGTGAFGIEALSRGALQVVFVEKAAAALRVMRRNLTACGLEKQAHVIRWDVERNLNCLERQPLKFDLVFMDPPYNRDLVRKGLSNLCLGRCLNRGCRIVIEHSALEPIPDCVAGFTVVDQRRYGKTLVSFLSSSV